MEYIVSVMTPHPCPLDLTSIITVTIHVHVHVYIPYGTRRYAITTTLHCNGTGLPQHTCIIAIHVHLQYTQCTVGTCTCTSNDGTGLHLSQRMYMC